MFHRMFYIDIVRDGGHKGALSSILRAQALIRRSPTQYNTELDIKQRLIEHVLMWISNNEGLSKDN